MNSTTTRFPSLLILALTLGLSGCGRDEPEAIADPAVDAARDARPRVFSYPETRALEVSDEYHGVTVADPFRWLESDVRESGEVAEWVAAQNRVTRAHLDSLPERAYFARRLAELWNYERFSIPERHGELLFYTRNDGLQDQSVLYVQEGADGEPRMLVDPNTWSEDGTVSLAQWVAGPEGRLVAYGIQDGGSDWRTWRVLDVESGGLLDDELEWLKFTSVTWDRDGEGFYYSRYPIPETGQEFQALNLDQRVYYHALGTGQSEDRLVYERPDYPDWGFSTEVTEDGNYLVITIWKGTDARYRVAWLDLTAPEAEPVMLVDEFEYDYTFIGNVNSRFYFRTNREAPNNRVVAVDVAANPPAWEEVIPEREHVLQAVNLVGGHLVANYLEHARSQVRVHALDGTPIREVRLPGLGAAGGFGGHADEPETFFSFTSFNQPASIYRYNVATGETGLWKAPEVDFDLDDYEIRQIFFESADGTRVPMFIAHRAGLTPDGDAPTLLYGYGGFNISLTPSFHVRNLAWMEAGGVYAQVNLRGGGEYGRQWHQAGTGTRKQNVFDDFIAAAEELIEAGYTSPDYLGIYGRSNGGLLVGAVVNQRPDLFAAALPAVGVMDMLRFNQFTAGRFWVDDYGSPENEEEFKALYAYSPYHNIEDGEEYPAVLATTADTDDRVVPGHSFKYAARLQQAQGGEAPVLIRIETRAGHGAGTPVSMLIDLYADQWGFLAHHTGLETR